jgi:hypothetical protein
VVGQQLAAVFFLQQRQIVSRTLEQALRARPAVGSSIFPAAKTNQEPQYRAGKLNCFKGQQLATVFPAAETKS